MLAFHTKVVARLGVRFFIVFVVSCSMLIFHVSNGDTKADPGDGVLISVSKTGESWTEQDLRQLLLAHNINSVEEYFDWLTSNVRYEHDPNGDEWAAPIETFIKQKGDCEDYAFLNAAVLRYFGHNPRVIAVSKTDGTHAFCVVKRLGSYVVIDNQQIIKTSATTLFDLITAFAQKNTTRYVLELFDQNKENSEILFQRG